MKKEIEEAFEKAKRIITAKGLDDKAVVSMKGKELVLTDPRDNMLIGQGTPQNIIIFLNTL